MSPVLALVLVLVVMTPNGSRAQQPAWELVREDFWGKIAIDPTNPDVIYVAPGHVPEFGLHKSTDGGKTWVNYHEGYEGLGDISGIVIDSKNPQRLWVYGGPFKGVARSEDGGVTAVKSDIGIVYDHHGYSVSAFAYDSKRDILYAGDTAVSGGIYRSFDGGRSWELVHAYGRGLMFDPEFFLVVEDSGWVYSGTGGHGIWRSKDSGVTWAPLDSELLGGQPVFFIARVPDSHTLYAISGDGNIYRSYDLGEKWILVSDGTTDSSEMSGGLVVSSLDTNYIYVAGKGRGSVNLKGGFFLSRDGGQSWQRYHLGLPELNLSNFDVWSLAQPSNSMYVYMSLLGDDERKYSIYRLSQMLITSIVDRPSDSLLIDFSLKQNYPNPFNGRTQVEFSVPRKEWITLDVYNLVGKYVVTLFSGQTDAGNHSVTWNGKNAEGGDVASGIYLLRLQVGEEVLIRKMLLIR